MSGKWKKQVIPFLEFMITPTFFGVILGVPLFYDVTSMALFVLFCLNFVLFLDLLILRLFRFKHRGLFKSLVSVPTGAFIELIIVFFGLGSHLQTKIEVWGLMLYITLLSIWVVGLYAYAIALKALEVIGENNKKFSGENKV